MVIETILRPLVDSQTASARCNSKQTILRPLVDSQTASARCNSKQTILSPLLLVESQTATVWSVYKQIGIHVYYISS